MTRSTNPLIIIVIIIIITISAIKRQLGFSAKLKLVYIYFQTTVYVKTIKIKILTRLLWRYFHVT